VSVAGPGARGGAVDRAAPRACSGVWPGGRGGGLLGVAGDRRGDPQQGASQRVGDILDRVGRRVERAGQGVGDVVCERLPAGFRPGSGRHSGVGYG
jgi:hypothetical protein